MSLSNQEYTGILEGLVVVMAIFWLAVSNKTPEELYYEWRREFDESLDEKMLSGQYLANRTWDLGTVVFCAGYQTAHRELQAHIQFLELQLREAKNERKNGNSRSGELRNERRGAQRR